MRPCAPVHAARVRRLLLFLERAADRGLKQEIEEQLVKCKRPWKLGLLLAGISLLIAGSFYYQAPDWDIPISFNMALFAYHTAPWSLRAVVERRWRRLPLMLFFTWFTVDGCYWLYWRAKNPAALTFMREVNFPASLCLYAMRGSAGYYKGGLKQLLAEAKAVLVGSGTKRA